MYKMTQGGVIQFKMPIAKFTDTLYVERMEREPVTRNATGPATVNSMCDR